MLTGKTKKVAIFCFMFMLISAAALAGLLFIVSARYTALREMGEKRLQHEEVSTHLGLLEELLSGTAAERERLESYILHEENVTGFLSSIEEIGRQQGVEVATKSLSVRDINEEFESLVAEFELTGSFSNVSSVVGMLERIPHNTVIERLILNSSEIEGVRTWNGSIEMLVTKAK